MERERGEKSQAEASQASVCIRSPLPLSSLPLSPPVPFPSATPPGCSTEVFTTAEGAEEEEGRGVRFLHCQHLYTFIYNYTTIYHYSIFYDCTYPSFYHRTSCTITIISIFIYHSFLSTVLEPIPYYYNYHYYHCLPSLPLYLQPRTITCHHSTTTTTI